jgi:hypothetical protein
MRPRQLLPLLRTDLFDSRLWTTALILCAPCPWRPQALRALHAVKELSVRGFGVHTSSVGTILAAHVVKKGADPVSEEPNGSTVHVVKCGRDIDK